MVKIKKFRLILDGKKIKDINKEVINLSKKERRLPSSSFFSMISDAENGKSKIFKLKKPIKSKKRIPEFIFL